MKTFNEFFTEDKKSKKLTVTLKNSPSKRLPRLIFESLQTLEEGKTKEWGKGYTYRLDPRPDHMGGAQLHIYGRMGQAWAYRYDGSRSERNKYTSSATTTVKEIVSDLFKLDPNDIEEAIIVSANDDELLVEIKFA